MRISLVQAILVLGLIGGVIATAAETDERYGHENWLLAKYDLNGDGRITHKEITSKKRNIFKYMDSDDDGGITFKEYESMDIAKREALLKSRFNKLDLDQDARISEKEYCNYMGLFDSIDSDGDGILTSTEMGTGQSKTTSTKCVLWFCLRTQLD